MKKKISFILPFILLALMTGFFILPANAQESTDSLQHSDILSVKTDEFEMEYFYFGTGTRPFIMIPGVSMKSIMPSADGITNSFAAFADRYTIYVFDRKKGIQSEYSVWDMANDTATAMMELGIQDADIFGASQGGMIAQCIAIEHPELVHALYLASTLSKQNDLSVDTFKTWMELAQGNDVEALNHNINTKVYSEEFYSKNESVFHSMEKDGTKEEMNRFYYLAKACLDFDCYDLLDKISCPVFVVASLKDHILGSVASEEISEKLNCPLELYEGYSHAVYDEAPDFRPKMLEKLSGLE